MSCGYSAGLASEDEILFIYEQINYTLPGSQTNIFTLTLQTFSNQIICHNQTQTELQQIKVRDKSLS